MPKLKLDVYQLLDRAIGSMTLAIELFNRPSELARPHTVLILLHHSFEMLLKAAILQKTGKVRDKSDKFTYRFDRCLAVAAERKILSSDEITTLSILDAQRDQAMHFYIETSEDILYVHAQSAVTLFAKVLSTEFKVSLSERIPSRVLPVSVRPPRDILLLLDDELQRVDSIMEQGTHQGARAAARLRGVLAFVTGAKDGHRVSEKEVRNAVKRRRQGEDWSLILPEIAQLRLSTEGEGIPIQMKIAKEAPIAVRIAKPGEEVVGTLFKLEVNIWDKFNLSVTDLANKLSMTTPRTLALVYELRIQEDEESYRELRKGKVVHKGYSKKALDMLRKAVSEGAAEQAWGNYRSRLAGRRNRATH
jgi:hypothetical protein